MTTASYQDIDSFIQFQKEKLLRDKSNGAINNNLSQTPTLPPQLYQQLPQSQQIDYSRQQLNEYLAKSRRASFDDEPQMTRQLNREEQQYQPPLQSNGTSQQHGPPQTLPRQTKKEETDFFNKFGKKYDAQKSKLKNDLQQEYKDYMDKKKKSEKTNRKVGERVSDEYYATLPLKGLTQSNKDRINSERNYEYQSYNLYDNRKNNKKKEPAEIKPYSKHSGSQENISFNQPLTNDSRSKSNYDVQQRFQNDFPPQQQQPQYDAQFDPSAAFRTRSANSYENMILAARQASLPMPMDAWQNQQIPIQPVIDPSLADILRRPPVGLKTPLPPQFQPSGSSGRGVQFNDSVQYNRYSPTALQFPPQFAQQQSYTNYTNNNNNLNSPKTPTTIHNPATTAKDAAFNFSEEQNKDIKAIKAREYQEELQRQVREKQMKKQREKEEQERQDKKFLNESASYNPYGKSGGGAPIKDREGNIVADLKQVRADPEQYSPRSLSQPPSNLNSYNPYNQPPYSLANPNTFSNNLNPYNQTNEFNNTSLNTSRSQKQSNDNNDGGGGYFRGGNGIFGEGKSEEQKKQEEKYKSDLQKQIEEKKRLKELEKEKIRLEEEKEQKRIEEQQKRIKAELEEEERKKKAKEENAKRTADDAKRLADEKRKQEANKKGANIKALNKRQQAIKSNGNIRNINEEPPLDESPVPRQQQTAEFRTNSPPVPAAAKKLNGNKPPPPANQNKPKQAPLTDTTADYYVTESRLNLRDINRSPGKFGADREVQPELIDNFGNSRNSSAKSNRNKKSDGFIPNKPIMKKSITNRPPSQTSNSEVLNQLQNLKKHLHNEQIQVENELQNANNRVTIGELADLHHNILNVRTPPGEISARYRREPSFQRTYRKDLETPPLNGGLEPRTYFRENTVLLGDPKSYNDNLFANHLEREANERQINRLSMLQDDALSRPYDIDQLANRNQQRLKKLREMEGDNFSLADPNEVLNKFLSRNNSNRAPSTTTLNDDTWLKNPT